MSEYKTGYKRPPKRSQFKKGQSGNLKGRPRKAPPMISIDVAEIMGRLDSETIDVGGRLMSRRQAEIYQLWNLEVKGDPTAIALLEKLRQQPANNEGGGVRYLPLSHLLWGMGNG